MKKSAGYKFMGRLVRERTAAMTSEKQNDSQEEVCLFGIDWQEVLEKTVLFLMILFMCFLFLNSMLHTTDMQKIEETVNTAVEQILASWESVIYNNDNLYLNVIAVFLALVICIHLSRVCSKASERKLMAGLVLWTLALGLIWVYSSQSSPTEDSYMVSNAALCFSQGNYSPLTDTRYFGNYPYQLGYVFFLELQIRIWNLLIGPMNTMLPLEAINVIHLAALNLGIVLLNREVFQKKEITVLTVILLAFSVQPVLSCVFVYGLIPGCTFAVYAVLLEIRFLKARKIRQAAGSVICIALAVMIKSNNLITVIAILCIGGCYMLNHTGQWKKYLIYLTAVLLLCFSMSSLVKKSYELRSGVELGDSVPQVSWFAMGLTEGPNAPGWYHSGPTLGNFEANNFDASEAKKTSLETIKEQLAYFIQHPQYADNFFYRKTLSQWNETSYQSIWNNMIRGQYQEKGKIAEWICYDGSAAVKKYMDIFTQMIFLAVLVMLCVSWKKRNYFAICLPLIVLGGFLFHTISEGKSQYILPYYIMLTGIAAPGIYAIQCRLEAWKRRKVTIECVDK